MPNSNEAKFRTHGKQKKDIQAPCMVWVVNVTWYKYNPS